MVKRLVRALVLGVVCALLVLGPTATAQTHYQQWPHPANWIVLAENGDVAGVTVFRFSAQSLTMPIIATGEDIWSGAQDALNLPTIFLPTTAAVNLRISSSNAGDTQVLAIQILDAAGDLVSFNATLAGLTFVDTGQPVLRLVSARVTGATATLGRVFLHIDTVDTGADGIPDAGASELLGVLPIGEAMLVQGAFTCPRDHTCYIIELEIAIGGSMNTAHQFLRLMTKPTTGAGLFSVFNAWQVTPGGNFGGALFPGTRLPALSDLKFNSIVSVATANGAVNAVIFAFRN